MLVVQYATFQHNETHIANKICIFFQDSSQHKTEIISQHKTEIMFPKIRDCSLLSLDLVHQITKQNKFKCTKLTI